MNANDNTNAQNANATHSLALTVMGDEFVVSCFPVVGGKADTSTEIFVRTYTDGSIARRIFDGYVRLMACKAAEFDAAVERVFHEINSLGSCLHREVRNEARILAGGMADLRIATLKRRDARREELRASVLARAEAALARRLEGLDAKIEAEAADRAAKGQR